MRVVGQRQQGHGGGENEGAADYRFLLLRHYSLDPAEEQGDADPRAEGRGLAERPGRFVQEQAEQNDRQADDLRRREIDEHDTPLQHLDAERGVNRRNDQPDDEGGGDDEDQLRVDRGLSPAARA